MQRHPPVRAALRTTALNSDLALERADQRAGAASRGGGRAEPASGSGGRERRAGAAGGSGGRERRAGAA
ncbi:hypothetical protein, partial [Actinoplanes nipponensis]